MDLSPPRNGSSIVDSAILHAIIAGVSIIGSPKPIPASVIHVAEGGGSSGGSSSSHGRPHAGAAVRSFKNDLENQEAIAAEQTADARTASVALMNWPRSEMCETCAGRKGTDANRSVETMRGLAECIKNNDPFYCHESTAVRDPNGPALDQRGNRYRRLPFNRWRLCRAWMNAQVEARKFEEERSEKPTPQQELPGSQSNLAAVRSFFVPAHAEGKGR